MKKLLLVLFVLFLLTAPRIAQADSNNACDRDDPACVSLKDDGRQDHDRDDCDRDVAGFDGCDRDDDDDDRDDDRDKKDKEDKRDRDRDDDDDDDDEGEDRDRDDDDGDDDEGEDRDRDDDDGDDDEGEDRDRDDEDDDDDEGEDRDKKDKDKKDKDRRDRDDDDDDGDEDDDGEEPDDDDDDRDDRPRPGVCRTIKDGGIYTSKGEEIVMGYDRWGYNYQAHQFNGWYENANREGSPVETGNIRFKMKWNDIYLSNKDCDGDGMLDRHYGYGSFYGTRAWLTNHYSWSYIGDDGNLHWVHWYLKMVAQPHDGFECASIGGTPFNGQFCTVKNVYYDPYGGSQGLGVLLDGLGFGGK